MTKMKIPAPKPNEADFTYTPLVRVGRVVPFGYKQDPEDPDVLLPVELELKLLEEAKIHLKRFSYRDVAAWISEESGRSISHMGLRNRILSEQKRRRTGTIQRQLVEQLKKAIKKAEKIENSYLGKKDPGSSEGSTT